MENTISTSVPKLVNQVKLAVAGVVKYGAALELPADLDATMNQEMADLTSSDNSHKQSKADLKARAASQRSALAACLAFCSLSKELLKPTFGKKYSEAWQAIGFANGLEIPREPGRMLTLLAGIKTFLTANPALENAPLNFMAARAQALHDELLNQRIGVAEAKSSRRTLSATRTGKAKLVRRRLRSLIDDLKVAMPNLDPRWLEFGLNIPGLLAVPGVPTNVVAVLVGPSAAAVKWNRAARGERYRLWKKVIGVDDEMVEVETREDLDFVFENLPAGKTIQLAVSAVNNGGESELSQVVAVTTP